MTVELQNCDFVMVLIVDNVIFDKFLKLFRVNRFSEGHVPKNYDAHEFFQINHI